MIKKKGSAINEKTEKIKELIAINDDNAFIVIAEAIVDLEISQINAIDINKQLVRLLKFYVDIVME